jgi:hypothetical protein
VASTSELAILIKAKDEASKVMGDIGSNAGGLGSKLGILAAAAAGAAAALISIKAAQDAISTTEDLGQAVAKLSRETGLSTEQSSELLFAFKHVGLSGDDASRSIGIFAKKLKGIQDEETGVATGGKSTAEILGDIGIKATDASGNILPLQDILGPLADQFKAMPDGMEKTGLAMQLFGRSGKDMIPLLNQGSQGLDDLSREADRLGLTLSGENVEKVKAFTFAHRDLDEAIAGLKVQVGLELMPVLTRFAGFLTEHQPQIREMMEAVGRLVSEGFQRLSDWFHEHQAEIEADLKAVGEFMGQVMAAWEAVWPTLRGDLEDVMAYIKAVAQVVKDVIVILDALLHGDWSTVWAGLKQLPIDMINLLVAEIKVQFMGLRDMLAFAVAVFLNIMTAGWTAIKDAVVMIATGLKDWLAENWRTIVQVALAILFPPAGGLFWIVTHFGEVKDAVLGFIGNIVDAITGLPGKVAALVGSWFGAARDLGDAMFRGLMEGLRQAPGMVEAFLSGIWEAIRDLINQAIDAVNNAIPNSIGAFGIGIDLPDNPIPHLAAGIRDFAGGLAWIGERGPELVALPRGSSVYSARDSRQMAAGATYHFHGDIILPGVREPADFAQGLYRALRLRGHTP